MGSRAQGKLSTSMKEIWRKYFQKKKPIGKQIKSLGVEHDGNGMLDYGETIELTLTLRNIGQQDGLNVTGELLTDDDYVTITAGQAGFGTIPAGGSGSNTTPFVFAISPEIPDQHEIELRLAVSEAPDTLTLALTAQAPELVVIAYPVCVAGSGRDTCYRALVGRPPRDNRGSAAS